MPQKNTSEEPKDTSDYFMKKRVGVTKNNQNKNEANKDSKSKHRRDANKEPVTKYGRVVHC